jgi:hypothetical protein
MVRGQGSLVVPLMCVIQAYQRIYDEFPFFWQLLVTFKSIFFFIFEVRHSRCVVK